MAFSISSLKSHPAAAPQMQAMRRAPQAAIRSAPHLVQRPESQPTYRSIAAAASASQQSAQQTTTASPALDGKAMLAALFPDMGGTKASPQSAPAAAAPTAESVFGDNPWLTSPTGLNPDGTTYSFNPQYFATPQTAAMVAQMVGGTVVEVNEMTNAPGSPYQQQQPNQMVQLKDGHLINPGLVAGFYTHGYSQSLVDQMIANEVTNT